MKREGFFIRWAAAFIDGLICVIPAMLLTFLVTKAAGPWFGAVILPLTFVAYSTLEILKGATFGKTILKLKICDDQGSQPAREVLIKRWAIKNSPWLLSLLAALTTVQFINWVASFAGIAYCISALLTFKAERQALHDTLCKTAVYKTETPAAAASFAAPEQHKQAA